MIRQVQAFLITIILVAIVILGVAVAIKFLTAPETTPTPSPVIPPIFGPTETPSPKGLEGEATKMAETNPIPPDEIIPLYGNRFDLLQAHLDEHAKDWVDIYTNVHSGNVYGVTPAQSSRFTDGPLSVAPIGAAVWEERHTQACEWIGADINPLCGYLKVGYTAVYKGIMHGGLNEDFSSPVVTQKTDDKGEVLWYEIERETKDGPLGNKITEVTYGAIAVVTYTGKVCINSVEEQTFSLVHENTEKPTDKSYTVRVEETHNWLTLSKDEIDLIGGNNINEIYLRDIAEGQAKTIALLPVKVTTMYSFVKGDIAPETVATEKQAATEGGKYYQKLKAFYTPELAKIYSVKGFEIVINITEQDPLLRCDGTPINK